MTSHVRTGEIASASSSHTAAEAASGYVYRAGDIVHHEPTGEDWVVAYLDGEHLAWCGWPAGEALARDCWLVKSCTDEDHRKCLELIARSKEGKRARMAQQALAALALSKECQIT